MTRDDQSSYCEIAEVGSNKFEENRFLNFREISSESSSPLWSNLRSSQGSPTISLALSFDKSTSSNRVHQSINTPPTFLLVAILLLKMSTLLLSSSSSSSSSKESGVPLGYFGGGFRGGLQRLEAEEDIAIVEASVGNP